LTCLRRLLQRRVVLRKPRSVGISSITSAPLKITFLLTSFCYKELFVVLFKAVSITGLEKHLLPNTAFREMKKKKSGIAKLVMKHHKALNLIISDLYELSINVEAGRSTKLLT
jgi:hypothetical protein